MTSLIVFVFNYSWLLRMRYEETASRSLLSLKTGKWVITDNYLIWLLQDMYTTKGPINKTIIQNKPEKKVKLHLEFK